MLISEPAAESKFLAIIAQKIAQVLAEFSVSRETEPYLGGTDANGVRGALGTWDKATAWGHSSLRLRGTRDLRLAPSTVPCSAQERKQRASKQTFPSELLRRSPPAFWPRGCIQAEHPRVWGRWEHPGGIPAGPCLPGEQPQRPAEAWRRRRICFVYSATLAVAGVC